MDEANSPKRTDVADDLVRQGDQEAFWRAAVSNLLGDLAVTIKSAARQVNDKAVVDAERVSDGRPVELRFGVDAKGQLMLMGTKSPVP